MKVERRYYIDSVLTSPTGADKANIRYKHDDGEIFFTLEYDGEISFVGNDFNIFKSDYDLGNYCTKYEMIIETKCNHEWEVEYMGYFSLLDGHIDLDKCIFKVKPTIEDKYSCIKKNEDVVIDLLDNSVDRYTITADCYTRIEFWYTSAKQEMDLLTTVTGVWKDALDVCGTNIDTDIYARESVILPENITPDSSWTEWNGDESLNAIEVPNYYKKWVRGLDYVTVTVNAGDIFIHCDDAYLEDTTLSYQKSITVFIPLFFTTNLYFKWTFLDTLYNLNAEISYVNAIKLTDAINYAKNQCSIGDLISEFFTNPINPVTGLASKTDNIYLIQKSDAKRPGASEQAIKGETTWKALMTAIQNYFNVKWYLDDDSNLVIEHISDILKATGIDITTSPLTNNSRKFKFDKNLIFKYEQWNVNEAFNIDFKGASIYYSDDCSLKNGKYETKNYDLGDYMTDLGYIQSKADKVSDTGFLIVACDNTDKVINETGILSGREELNGHLAISSLHDNYWKHERIFISGNMNGINTTFESAMKLRQLDKINYVKCCTEEFNPMDSITTSLGTASVDNASLNLLDNKLELDLYI